MKILVMTTKKMNPEEKAKAVYKVKEKTGESRLTLTSADYDGETREGIKTLLQKEPDNTVIVTADSRLLSFVHTNILLSRVYLTDGEQVLKLTNCTQRVLRQGHNLMKLFDAGEFEISDFRHEPEYIRCPDCNGRGGDVCYDIEDYVPCATCNEHGVVPEGTKPWLLRFLMAKPD